VEISKLKLEIYDLLGTLVPGFLAMLVIASFFSDWHAIAAVADKMSGTTLTLLILLSFAAGQIVQEAGDWLIKRICGPRFFKRSRDDFWASSFSEAVRKKIQSESSVTIDSADAAFDYCLTSIGSKFPRRDIFLAVSDMARSLWLLSLLVLIPIVHAIFHINGVLARVWFGSRAVVVVVLIGYFAWSRMVRFRVLSELPVFHVFLATSASASSTPTRDLQEEDES
jgi:hypothetical protein